MTLNKQYEPLEFLAHYKETRRRGPLDYLSLSISILGHAAIVYLLIVNPQWMFYPLRLFLPSEIFTSAEERAVNVDQGRVLTYLANNRPMYAPVWRKPEGDLYSAQSTTAISRPPQIKPGGNRLPYSRGTTKDLTITDVIEEKPSASADGKNVETASLTAPPVGPQGMPPLSSAPGLQPTDPSAMVIPPKPELTPNKPGNPLGSPASQADAATTSAVQPEPSQAAPAKQTLEEQKVQIFDNEASALRSEKASGFFDTKGFELSGYSQYIIDRIKQNWLIPASIRYENGRSTVLFYIEKDGQISRLRIVTPSGIALLDRAALNSILESQPFPPLPGDFPGEHVGAKLVFAYNSSRSSN